MVLNDICKVITCGVAKRPEYVKDGVPFLSSKNVKANRFILNHYNMVSKEDYLTLTKHNKPEKGDVLYTRVGSYGEAAIVDFDFEFAVFVSLTLIKPNFDLVDNRYLMHFLNSPKIRKLADESTSGIGVKNLNVKAVRSFPIELPPLATQKKIAAILDEAGTLRQLNTNLIVKYDALTQSLFLEMFGDPVTNPMSWEKLKFTEIAEFDTNMTSDFEKYGNLFHVGIANIEKYTGIIKNCKRVKDEGLSSGKYVFTENHIIYSKIRPILNKVALPNFTGLCSADSYPILPKKNIVNKLYLAFLLRSSSFIEYILKHSTRTNIPKANKSQIKLYKGIVPPINLQNQFAERVALIEQQKAQAQQSLQKSEDLFNSLLQKAFKGELV